MLIQTTKIQGFREISFPVHEDERGTFEQWFSEFDSEASIGKFEPVQANISISKQGVIRGIHYSTVDEGQAKMVVCVHGKIHDVVVDVRGGSKTYGKYHAVELEAGSGRAVFISAGLGHAFEVLSDSATIVYLLSSRYRPKFEKEINPLDPDLNIQWSSKIPILSKKDREAESFARYTERLNNA